MRDDENSEQEIADQRNDLGDEKKISPLISAVVYVKNKSGKRADRRKEYLCAAYGCDNRLTQLFHPSGKFQIFFQIAGEEIENESRGHVKYDGESGEENFHGRFGGILNQPVGQISRNHKNIEDRYAQKVPVEFLTVPAVIDQIDNGNQRQDDT